MYKLVELYTSIGDMTVDSGYLHFGSPKCAVHTTRDIQTVDASRCYTLLDLSLNGSVTLERN